VSHQQETATTAADARRDRAIVATHRNYSCSSHWLKLHTMNSEQKQLSAQPFYTDYLQS